MSSLIASGASDVTQVSVSARTAIGQLVVGDDVVDHGSFVDDRAGVEQTAGDAGRRGSRWTRVGLDASEQEQ